MWGEWGDNEVVGRMCSPNVDCTHIMKYMPPSDENQNSPSVVPQEPETPQGNAPALQAMSDTTSNDEMTPSVDTTQASVVSEIPDSSVVTEAEQVTVPVPDSVETTQTEPSSDAAIPEVVTIPIVETPSPNSGDVMESEHLPETVNGSNGVSEPIPSPSASGAVESEITQSAVATTVASTSIVLLLLQKGRAIIQLRKYKKLERIMGLFAKKPHIRNDDVEKLLRVSDATATRYLSLLERSGKITQSGKAGRGVVYVKT